MKRTWILIALMLALALFLAACAAPASAPSEEPAAPAAEEPAVAPTEPPAEAVDFITWFQYDQNNEDPASDERVGNAYLRKTIPMFNKDFAGKWNWVNQPKAFDKMTTELVAAVQAGGEVPDLFELSNTQDVISFYRNGTAQDLREWAEAQPWFKDLDPGGIKACTAPDGALLCVPVAQRPQLVYVWKDHMPTFPQSEQEFMDVAAALKEKGVYAMTFFGSTDKGGEGLTRAIWTVIASYGGSLDDGHGKMVLDTPENVAAIKFLRTIVSDGYVPEIAFAGGFQEEEAFKDASAASFPTGLFGYRYVNPLTAPNGTKYDKGNQEDMLDAIAAGDVYLTHFYGVGDNPPGCGVDVAGFVIPNGAKNVEAAHDYISWIMTPEQNADYVVGPGGGFPVLKTTQSDEAFQTPFYQEAAAAIGASACRPWYGSLERPNEAQELVMATIYKLIKEDPTADISAELQVTQEEYNANN